MPGESGFERKNHLQKGKVFAHFLGKGLVHKISGHAFSESLLPSSLASSLGMKNITHAKDDYLARFQKLKDSARANLKIKYVKDELPATMQIGNYQKRKGGVALRSKIQETARLFL